MSSAGLFVCFRLACLRAQAGDAEGEARISALIRESKEVPPLPEVEARQCTGSFVPMGIQPALESAANGIAFVQLRRRCVPLS